MNALNKRTPNAGIATAEMVMVLVVVAALIGIGAYVLHRNLAAKTSTTASTINAPAGGTTESIDQITANDAATEQQADKNADSRMQQDATSANSAVSNVGGAYDESTL